VKVSISSAVLLAFTMVVIGCAKHSSNDSNDSNLADGQEDAILKSKNLDDTYVFRNSETNEIEVSDGNGISSSQKYTYLLGSPHKWSGTINWWYNPAGQPSYLTNTDAINALIAVTQQWSAVCGVKFAYQGLTSNKVYTGGCNGSTVVGWSPLSGGTVGYTHACYGGTGYFNEFDLALDNEQPLQINSVSMLKKVAIHEFGHAFGLGHTDVSPAVMTAMLSTGTPVPDDIAGCQSLYGPSTTPTTSTTTTTTTTTTIKTTTTTLAPTTTTTTMAPAPTATPTTTTTVPTTTSWVRCASEGQTCSFSGTHTVRYGTQGVYTTKVVTSSIPCTNTAFGGDPKVGYVKACDYSTGP
jgi:hypothetical protein